MLSQVWAVEKQLFSTCLCKHLYPVLEVFRYTAMFEGCLSQRSAELSRRITIGRDNTHFLYLLESTTFFN